MLLSTNLRAWLIDGDQPDRRNIFLTYGVDPILTKMSIPPTCPRTHSLDRSRLRTRPENMGKFEMKNRASKLAGYDPIETVSVHATMPRKLRRYQPDRRPSLTNETTRRCLIYNPPMGTRAKRLHGFTNLSAIARQPMGAADDLARVTLPQIHFLAQWTRHRHDDQLMRGW
jgi:hypothetical protein